jgi:hypothetical protein
LDLHIKSLTDGFFKLRMKIPSLFLFFPLSAILLHVCRGATDLLYVTDFAGNGTTGYLGENLAATSSEMYPRGLW